MSVNPFCHAELVSTTVPNKIHLKKKLDCFAIARNDDIENT